MKKALLVFLAVLGFASQAGSKTAITLNQIQPGSISGVMVNTAGGAGSSGWVLAQLDPSIVLDTSTAPPTLRAVAAATPQTPWVTPTGAINGTNATFTLPSAPNPPDSLTVIRNGLTQSVGVDFTLSGATITFLAGAIPGTGDILRAK